MNDKEAGFMFGLILGVTAAITFTYIYFDFKSYSTDYDIVNKNNIEALEQIEKCNSINGSPVVRINHNGIQIESCNLSLPL